MENAMLLAFYLLGQWKRRNRYQNQFEWVDEGGGETIFRLLAALVLVAALVGALYAAGGLA